MSIAVDTREQRAQKYRLRDWIEVYVKPPSPEKQVIRQTTFSTEAGELFWWNCEHFVSVNDGAKISRSMINKLKNRMIPVDEFGKDIDLS